MCNNYKYRIDEFLKFDTNTLGAISVIQQISSIFTCVGLSLFRIYNDKKE